MRTRRPIVPSLLGLTLAAAGCASTGSASGPEATPRVAFTTFTWGMSAAALADAYPVTPTGADRLALARATYKGEPASVGFVLEGGALVAIDIDFDLLFASMDACGETWARVRRAMDADFGKSASDNLAAYWDGDAGTIELACNIGDGEAAALSATLRPTR